MRLYDGRNFAIKRGDANPKCVPGLMMRVFNANLEVRFMFITSFITSVDSAIEVINGVIRTVDVGRIRCGTTL